MNAGSGDREHGLQQARALQRARKWNEAADLFAQLLAEDPEDADALHAFGVLHAQRGDRETAIALIAKRLRWRRKNAIAHYNLAKALRDAGRREEALRSYDRAAALMPQNVDAWSNRGTILQELGRPREAVESFDRALAINPSHVPSLHNRANALNDLSLRQDAIAGYDMVLRLEPNNTFALNGRAGVLRDLNRFDEALRDYNRVFALDPDFPYIKGWRLHANMHLCNWETLASDTCRDRTRYRSRQGRIVGLCADWSRSLRISSIEGGSNVLPRSLSGCRAAHLARRDIQPRQNPHRLHVGRVS
jgi:Flp pilus assembly protein TadD